MDENLHIGRSHIIYLSGLDFTFLYSLSDRFDEASRSLTVWNLADDQSLVVEFVYPGSNFQHTGPLAIDVLRNTGTAIIVGIFEEPSSFNFFSLSGTDKKVMGTLAYTIEDFKGLAALMAKGVIKAENLITGKIELKDIMEKGFLELINNKDENIKILVRP